MRITLAAIAILSVIFIAGLETSSAQECRDGETWKEDCNTCQCIGGRRACTRKMCISPRGSQDYD